MKITVTKYHILVGARSRTETCPVALAIKDAFSDLRVKVFWNHIHIKGKNIFLPDEIVKWIDDFDKCRPSKPITFDLEVGK